MRRSFITFNRIVSYGFKNFFRNAWLSIAATAVMVVALTIILLAVVLNITARNAIKDLSKNLKASIYLKENVSEEKRSQLETEIRRNSIVADVTYVPSEEANKKFSESFKNDPRLLEGLALVGTNSLPSSEEVSVTNLDRISEISKIAKSDKYKDTVDSITLGKTDAKKTIDRAASAQHFIIIASIISASVFAGVSVLIIFNTIRMAIYTRGEEIRTMKLIGATPNFIRGPFLVESSMYGIIAGLIANAAVYSAINSLGPKLSTQSEFKETFAFLTSYSIIATFIIGAVGVGILVGIVSSMLAMEKHLKLKHW